MISIIQRILHLSLAIWFLALSILFLSEPLHAQNALGAKSMALGQTGTAIPQSSWSVFSNAALLPDDQKRVSFYGYRYAGISEITDVAASFIFPSNAGTFGTGLHRYGFDLFNENRFLLSYKNNLDRFHYGATVSYTHVFQGEGYGSAGAVGVDLGLAALITDELWFGARATNINRPAYGSTDEELPRELAAGLSYRLSSIAFFTAEVVKDVKFPLSVRGGIEFEVFRSLFARAGITTEPSTYSGGFGYQAETWEINLALQQHDPLGLSPAIDFGLRF